MTGAAITFPRRRQEFLLPMKLGALLASRAIDPPVVVADALVSAAQALDPAQAAAALSCGGIGVVRV